MVAGVGSEETAYRLEHWREVDWQSLPPSERLVTLPVRVPQLTLGWHVVRWISDNLIQPNGPRAGEPFCLTEGQVRFVLLFYEVDGSGAFVCNEGVRRLAKGSGKSPFAAALALAEMLGPVVFAGFDSRVPGGCLAVERDLAWVQVAATSEEQTKNTMRMVRAMVSHRNSRMRDRYGLQVGKTFLESRSGARLEQITSAATTAEGNEISFCVCDETEHWTPARGGNDLYETLVQNLGKTRNSRLLQTSNAWDPGEGSVAEETWNAWVLQESDRSVNFRRLLYDARMAPENTCLSPVVEPGMVGLDAALEFVYADCEWAALDNMKATIWKPNYPQSRSWRFFMNRPMVDANAWCPSGVFMDCHDPDRVVERGESVVLFFDGSKSNDFTALVGCCLSDGFVFTVGVWRPDEVSGVVDVDLVDRSVRAAFEAYDVVAFWADVREWESFVHTSWAEAFGDRLAVWAVPGGSMPKPIAWDMRSHTYQFAEACERVLDEITSGGFTHDGHWELVAHVANCRVKEYRGRWMVKKESPKSPRKIDAAVCMIGARMLFHVVRSSDEWQNRVVDAGWSIGW